MYSAIPYILLALGFCATLVGVLRSADKGTNRFGKVTVALGASVFILGTAQLFFAPSREEIRISENFDASGWNGFLIPGEEVVLASKCGFRWFIEPATFDEFPYFANQAIEAVGGGHVAFDEVSRAFIPSSGALGTDVTTMSDSERDTFLGSLVLIEQFFEVRSGDWQIQANVTRVPTASVDRQLTVYFPEFVFQRKQKCSGSISVGKNLEGYGLDRYRFWQN